MPTNPDRVFNAWGFPTQRKDSGMTCEKPVLADSRVKFSGLLSCVNPCAIVPFAFVNRVHGSIRPEAILSVQRTELFPSLVSQSAQAGSSIYGLRYPRQKTHPHDTIDSARLQDSLTRMRPLQGLYKISTHLKISFVFTRDSAESLDYDIFQLNVLHEGRLMFQLARYSRYRSIFS
ncbi:hypothetical protein CSKR_110601 [Clonorchis sinensis]|uniref:Uncharacterized protein n=1 Tax=Clonorchis sinensis TaxID=79923 RepID=A0A3R7FNV1_CLOSI|nr:hypothetical protein CSKR_110601 [Clonorchis sinensis]